MAGRAPSGEGHGDRAGRQLGFVVRLDMDDDAHARDFRRSASSMRSQMSWAAPTVMSASTTMWNSMKVARPAMRVFRSCTSSAPSACAEMMARMRSSSARPWPGPSGRTSEAATTCQPCHRMLTATSAAMIGSSSVQPVSDGHDQAAEHADRGHDVGHDVAAVGGQRRRAALRPARIRTSAQTRLMTVATPLIAMPSHRRLERRAAPDRRTRPRAGSGARRR